ncbi:MAG: hypothetical protein AAFP92_33325, partial [Bacteroidota bacterium]
YHEYFLADAQGVPYFAQDSATQATILADKVGLGLFDIRQQLEILPSEETKHFMARQKMRLLMTSTGFRMVMSVVADETGGFKPQLPLPAKTPLHFTLRPVNPYFDSLTESPPRPFLPAIHLLSTEGKALNGSDPINLARPLEAFQENQQYQMGELVSLAGAEKRAIRDTQTQADTDWVDLEASGYISQADRVLLPQSFCYQFPKYRSLSKATFEVLDMTNESLATLEVPVNRQKKACLDFSGNKEGSPAISPGRYQLKVTGTGFDRLHSIQLQPDLYQPQTWGIMLVSLENSAEPTSILRGGSLPDEPVKFEIRLRSRTPYWRYINKKGFHPDDEVTATEGFFDSVEEGGNVVMLVSKQPKPISQTLSPLSTPDGSSFKLFPPPQLTDLRQESDRQFADIHITPINPLITIK